MILKNERMLSDTIRMPELVTRPLLDDQTQGTFDMVVLHALRKTNVSLPKSSNRN